jgi:hypothetical protein
LLDQGIAKIGIVVHDQDLAGIGHGSSSWGQQVRAESGLCRGSIGRIRVVRQVLFVQR